MEAAALDERRRHPEQPRPAGLVEVKATGVVTSPQAEWHHGRRFEELARGAELRLLGRRVTLVGPFEGVERFLQTFAACGRLVHRQVGLGDQREATAAAGLAQEV